MSGTLNLSSGESYTYKGVTLLNVGTGDCTLNFGTGEFSGDCQFIVPEGISIYGIVVDFSGIKIMTFISMITKAMKCNMSAGAMLVTAKR